MTRLLTLSAAAALAGVLVSAPAAAQEEAGDRVNQVIIFGEDECPQSEGNTITVCARLDESERYRIPPTLRSSNSPDNEAWARRAESLEAVGAFGPLSCTPAGAGGDLGCTMQMIEAAYAEREQGNDVRMAELISAARAERLAEIDGDAAAMQARVEELERAEFERRRIEQGRPIEGEGENSDLPVLVNPDAIPDAPPAVATADD